MKKVIILLFCKRPKYVHLVLQHLSRCIGIKDYHLIIQVDGPGNPEITKLCANIKSTSHELHQFKYNHGVNFSTREVLRRGFWQADYVIHVEEDVLLAPDALQMFEWARQYGADQTLLNIAGIRHASGWLPEHGPFPSGQEIEKKIKRDPSGFGCWGWATWKDRWERLDKIWSDKSDIDLSWDTRITQWRAEQKLNQLAPLVSRVQNIGAEHGVHRGDYILSYWAGSDGFKTPSNYYLIE